MKYKRSFNGSDTSGAPAVAAPYPLGPGWRCRLGLWCYAPAALFGLLLFFLYLTLLAVPFHPVDADIRQAANSRAILAMAAVARLGQETNADGLDQLRADFFLRRYAVLARDGGEVERTDPVEFHRSALRHEVAHHAAQCRQHSAHVGRTDRRLGGNAFSNLFRRDRRTHEDGTEIPKVVGNDLDFLPETHVLMNFKPRAATVNINEMYFCAPRNVLS